MGCTLADSWLDFLPDGTTRPVRDATVFLVPTQWPVWIQRAGDVAPILLSTNRPSTSTDEDGHWQLVAPWPSETPLNPGLQWQIVLPDYTIFQGNPPEGIPGPLDLAALLGNPYNWLQKAAGSAITTATLTYQPDTGLLQGQALFPGFFGNAETITTTPTTAGGLTISYRIMGLTIATTFNPDGTITEAFGAPINRTRTTTLNHDGSITEEST